MAYADQQMSGNKITAIIIVAVIHVLVGYALVTGLAFSAAKKIAEKMQVIDIKEEVKEEKLPPPPPKKIDMPPPVTRIDRPPVKMDLAPVNAPVVPLEPPAPPAPPAPPLAVAPPAPPPAPSQARGARAKNQGSWAARIQDNYPASAMREEKQGRVGVRVTIGPDGRVTGCTVTSSSGTPALDAAACDGMQRFGRYDPALDDAGRPTTGQASTAIVYRLN